MEVLRHPFSFPVGHDTYQSLVLYLTVQARDHSRPGSDVEFFNGGRMTTCF